MKELILAPKKKTFGLARWKKDRPLGAWTGFGKSPEKKKLKKTTGGGSSFQFGLGVVLQRMRNRQPKGGEHWEETKGELRNIFLRGKGVQERTRRGPRPPNKRRRGVSIQTAKQALGSLKGKLAEGQKTGRTARRGKKKNGKWENRGKGKLKGERGIHHALTALARKRVGGGKKNLHRSKRKRKKRQGGGGVHPLGSGYLGLRF